MNVNKNDKKKNNNRDIDVNKDNRKEINNENELIAKLFKIVQINRKHIYTSAIKKLYFVVRIFLKFVMI
jgi:hypothetical protein